MRSRRALLSGAAAVLLGGRAALAQDDYALFDLTVPGDPKLATRFVLLAPAHAREKVPLLVAFHGLGETTDQKTGAYAWVDAYGLGSCYRRLLHPPIAPADKRARFWTDARLAAVNAALAARPFGGLAVACPYTPDAFKAVDRDKLLDAYAAWIVAEVIPRARREAPILADARATGLDGVSLGGFMSMEVFLRRPQHFGAWGSVQGAYASYRLPSYADKLKQLREAGLRQRLHIETSLSDTYRDENEALSSLLKARGVPHDFIEPPGAHTQPFLRDSGTLEMLLWHDRALRGLPAS